MSAKYVLVLLIDTCKANNWTRLLRKASDRPRRRRDSSLLWSRAPFCGTDWRQINWKSRTHFLFCPNNFATISRPARICMPRAVTATLTLTPPGCCGEDLFRVSRLVGLVAFLCFNRPRADTGGRKSLVARLATASRSEYTSPEPLNTPRQRNLTAWKERDVG
ncbi:unnamed protein product [Protopolystoma xenopodis]|uniref:Uncharacterized protein n=1 Tax=Protopolystoma xenopodis TaxID=117903 RepID=A0A3S5B138_9PLAT|nr:unnamed protein product [Protopolystoma xenopodis]